MRKDGTYRWERRRKRREGQKARREFQAFWGFELSLLFLVFFIGTVGVRIFLLQALNTSYCIEAVASYGGGETFQSVFQAFFWLTIIGIAFWLAISFSFRKQIRKSKSKLFHGAQLICLIILAGSFNALHIENLDAPDGLLPVRFSIVDLSKEEPKLYLRPDSFLIDETVNKYTYWSIGEPETGDIEDWNPSCVWIDKKLITLGNSRRIDGYGDLSVTERLDSWYQNQYSPIEWAIEIGLAEIKYFITAFYGRYTALERLKDTQTYRSMTSAEVEQFKAKQSCLHKTPLSEDLKTCELYWVFDEEQFRWDHYFDPNATPPEFREYPNR